MEIPKARCRLFPQVHIRDGTLPEDLPTQTFDLIVFSEVGYYFSRQELASLIARLWSRLKPDGRLIACHWLGHSEDHKLHGRVVHETINHALAARSDFYRADDAYTLQSWSKEER